MRFSRASYQSKPSVAMYSFVGVVSYLKLALEEALEVPRVETQNDFVNLELFAAAADGEVGQVSIACSADELFEEV